MIGGLFIYNHKGEVLISRVYRDDIGFVQLEYRIEFVEALIFVSFFPSLVVISLKSTHVLSYAHCFTLDLGLCIGDTFLPTSEFFSANFDDRICATV